MSLLEMQTALCRILTDDSLRRSYLDDPMSVLSSYSLNDNEKASLLNLDRSRLGRYSDMLLINRLDLAFKALPRLRMGLWKIFLQDHARLYGALNLPVPCSTESPMFREVASLTSYLASVSSALCAKFPAFSDILRYERTMFILANDPMTSTQAEEFEEGHRHAGEIRAAEHAHPRLSSATSIIHFGYNILEPIIDAEPMSITSVTPDLVLLFQKRVGIKKVRVFRINLSTAKLLEQCTGTRNMMEITDSALGTRDRAESRKCYQILDTLRGAGVLYFAQ